MITRTVRITGSVLFLCVFLAVSTVYGQNILRFTNGWLTFETPDTGLFYTVEWSPNLENGNAWSNETIHLRDIISGDTNATVPVPVMYRVTALPYARPFGVMGAVVCETSETYALVGVTAGEALYTNVNVFVNDTALRLIEMENDPGGPLDWTNTLPVFGGTLTNVGVSSVVTLRVVQVGGPVLYESAPLTIPDRPVIVNPNGLTPVPTNTDMAITWIASGNTAGFFVGYESLQDENAESVSEDVSDAARGVIVGAGNLVPGTCTVSVAAYDVDPPEYPLNEDSEAALMSFFVITPDVQEIVVATNGAGVNPPARGPRVTRVPLQVVKEYEKRVEHITFLVKECNPYQITAPGIIEIDVTYRANERAVGNYTFYDMNGAKYHEFTYTHIYRPNKRRHVYRWPVQPGTTVVIALAKTYLNGAVYETP